MPRPPPATLTRAIHTPTFQDGLLITSQYSSCFSALSTRQSSTTAYPGPSSSRMPFFSHCEGSA